MNSTTPGTFLITCVDPGRTTGLSLFQVTPAAVSAIHQCAEPYIPEMGLSPVNTIVAWAERHHGTPHILLYEGFHVRPGQSDVDPVGLEIIGALKDRLMTRALKPYARMIAQEPVHAKRRNKPMVTDAVLRRLGLLAMGKDSNHINDTARHAVTWLADRHPNMSALAWPRTPTEPEPRPPQDPGTPTIGIPTQR